MDYSKFNDDEFNAKDWINSAFKAHNKEGNLEQHATTLVMKLQMFMQEVNNVIDDSCQQVVNNLPRVNKDLETVKQEAVMLQQQMKMVKYDIQKVEHDTAQSMQSLLALDCIKSNMKSASDALKEADNWTSLSADVDDVFETQNVDEIAKKIIGMQQSLHILTDVPDYSERCQYLEVLKNRLEATSSPSIVTAFTNLDLEAAQRFSRMFQDIGRTEQLSKYYHKCQKAKVLECWKEVCERINKEEEENEDGGDDDDAVKLLKGFQRTLDAFYDSLLDIIQTQIKWSEHVFENPLSTVFEMVSDSFKSLQPSPTSVIQQFIMTSSSSSSSSPTYIVDSLIAVKSTTDNFVSFLEGSFTDQQLDSCTAGSIEGLLSSFYCSFLPAIKHFPKLEQEHLSRHLDAIKLDHPDFMESTSLLQQSINKIFNFALQSNERCMMVSKGVAYPPYLAILKEHLLAYVKEVARVMTNIFEKCKPSKTANVTSPASLSSSSSSSAFHLDTDEWTHFQNSLRLILFSGELVSRLDELTRQIGENVLSVREQAKSVKSNKRRLFMDASAHLMTCDKEKRQLQQLIDNVKEDGGKSILADVTSEVTSLCACVHRQSFDIVFNPLKYHFQSLLHLPVWSSDVVGSALTSDLPDFSFIPQEYITNVGQYLMTLPQQLDPFSNEDNSTMRTALLHGDLPFLQHIAPEHTEHLADVWLRALANGCMAQLVKCVLQIPHLTPPSTKQLLVDINYLLNVLEDLGLPVSEDLEAVKRLLCAGEEEYRQVGDSCPQKFVSTIASMRGITAR